MCACAAPVFRSMFSCLKITDLKQGSPGGVPEKNFEILRKRLCTNKCILINYFKRNLVPTSRLEPPSPPNQGVSVSCPRGCRQHAAPSTCKIHRCRATEQWRRQRVGTISLRRRAITSRATCGMQARREPPTQLLKQRQP